MGYWRELCREAAKIQTITMGKLALWLEFLPPDQKDMISIPGRDKTWQTNLKWKTWVMSSTVWLIMRT
jgi:hypothetical protein